MTLLHTISDGEFQRHFVNGIYSSNVKETILKEINVLFIVHFCLSKYSFRLFKHTSYFSWSEVILFLVRLKNFQDHLVQKPLKCWKISHISLCVRKPHPLYRRVRATMHTCIHVDLRVCRSMVWIEYIFSMRVWMLICVLGYFLMQWICN